jgi:oligopeptide/dipeptide ABC transporter ATP-binding protein
VGSVPLPDPDDRWQGRVDLPPEERMTSVAPVGCKYRPRCPFAMPRCAEAAPPLYQLDEHHRAACYLYAPE